MPRQIKAIVYTGVDQVEFRQLELAPCGDDEIVCETLYTFVSPGTELRVLGGHYGAAKRYPLIPGYSVVARVVEVGSGVKGYRVGDLVSGRNPQPVPGVDAMWGGQASAHLYTTDDENRPVLLPDGADPLDYLVAEVSAISFRGVEAAAARPGESAIVIGQGLIGSFSAAWLVQRGCRVIACDIDDRRLGHARRRGIGTTVNMADDGAMQRLVALTNGGADIVVESSGSIPGVEAAYKLLRKKPQAYGDEYKVEPIGFYHGDWPRLVMQANYIDTVSIKPFGFTPGEGVTILSPADRGVEDRQKVVEHIRAGHLDGRSFVEKVVPVDEAPEAYRKLKDREILSVAYNWQ